MLKAFLCVVPYETLEIYAKSDLVYVYNIHMYIDP